MPDDDPLGDAIDSLYSRYRAKYEIGSEAESANTKFGCTIVSLLVLLGILSRFNLPRDVTNIYLAFLAAYFVFGGLNVIAKRKADKRRIKDLAREGSEADKRRWAFIKVLHDRRVDRLAAEPGEQEFKYLVDRTSDALLREPAECWLKSQDALKTDGLTIPESIKGLHEGVRQKTDETLVDLMLMGESAKATEDRDAFAERAREVSQKFEQVAHEAGLSIKSFAATELVEPDPTTSMQSLDDRLAELRHVREAVTEMESEQKLEG